MTIPGPVIKVVMKGTYAGQQEWSTAFWVKTTAYATLAAFTAEMNGAFQTALGANATPLLKSLLNGADSIDQFLYYYYDSSSASLTYQVASAPLGIAGTASGDLPYNCALVATLLTPIDGRSYRGRMYLPARGVTLSNSQLNLPTVTTVAADVAGLFTAINGTSAGTQVVVASATRGLVTAVSQVRVDSKMDVQRRRQDKIAALTSHVTAV